MRYFALIFAVPLTACDGASNLTKSDDEIAVEAVQAFVVRDFKDPSSAQFRNVKVLEGTVCGEVNGKNSFGAYAGYDKFYGIHFGEADRTFGRVMQEENEAVMAAFGDAYEQHCDENNEPRTREEQSRITAEQFGIEP